MIFRPNISGIYTHTHIYFSSYVSVHGVYNTIYDMNTRDSTGCEFQYQKTINYSCLLYCTSCICLCSWNINQNQVKFLEPEHLSYSLTTVYLLLHIQSLKYLNYLAYLGSLITPPLILCFTIIYSWYNCAVVAVNSL